MARAYVGIGSPGPTGPAGPTGPQGPAGPIANWRGSWDAGISYAADDGVTATDGNLYISQVNANVGHNPVADSGANWSRVLPLGIATARSPGGVAGLPAPIGVGLEMIVAGTAGSPVLNSINLNGVPL